jgi:DNA repair protein RadC
VSERPNSDLAHPPRAARLRQAGDLMGIKILDHVVVGDGSFRSFAEANLL